MPQFAAAVKREKTERAVELRAKHWTYQAIADDLGVNRNTATNWIEDELANRSEHRGVDKEAHLAVYDAIQKAAWDAFDETHESSLNRSGYLNTIKAAEDSKTKITGAEAPKKYQDVTTDTFEIVFDDDEITTR